MNIPVVWAKEVLSDNSVQFVSESTVGGPKVATATLNNGKIEWSTDDVPMFVIERAEAHFGLTI